MGLMCTFFCVCRLRVDRPPVGSNAVNQPAIERLGLLRQFSREPGDGISVFAWVDGQFGGGMIF
jgi:hypothetical protein